MELDWLEDFLALSASGSFSRAAEQRHVTQPAFSRRIRALEPGLRTGPIQLVSDSLQACEELMLQGRAQFLLCHHHPGAASRLDAPGFLSARVGADTLVPVAAADGPGGGPRFAMPGGGGARGHPLPVLAYSEESGLGRILRAVRGEALAGARLEAVFTSHLAVVLKRMALDGRGVAWLPLSLIGDELGDGRLVRAGGDDWLVPVEIRLVRRRDAAPPAAEAFWRVAGGHGPNP